MKVTPFAGVWIEIWERMKSITQKKSLPSRECGLKSADTLDLEMVYRVTPFAGVWIEILGSKCDPSPKWVTPFAGVWIEISRIRPVTS